MSDRSFVDTNVLIHAHDLDAGAKRQVAARLLADLWEQRNGVLSTQVLQEFYLNVTRKIAAPLPAATAREIIGAYGAWVSAPITLETILLATGIEERHRISFWDALIVAAATEAGATRILSEDFTHQRVIEGITTVNPFR
jgi:predicted nucleic acid-binding protein